MVVENHYTFSKSGQSMQGFVRDLLNNKRWMNSYDANLARGIPDPGEEKL